MDFLKKIRFMLYATIALRAYAVADDKLCPPGTFDNSNPSSLVEKGNKLFKNVMALIGFPFADSICGKKEAAIIYCRTSPVGDAGYANLDIGSIAIQLTIAATAVTAVTIWLKTGAATWKQINTSAVAAAYFPAVIDQFASAGGDTTESGLLTGALSTDKIRIESRGLGYVKTAAWTADGAWIATLSADPGTTGVLTVEALRAQ